MFRMTEIHSLLKQRLHDLSLTQLVLSQPNHNRAIEKSKINATDVGTEIAICIYPIQMDVHILGDFK